MRASGNPLFFEFTEARQRMIMLAAARGSG